MGRHTFNTLSLLFILSTLFACNAGIKNTPTSPTIPPRDQVTMGNGQDNVINTENFQQEGSTFTFE